MRIGSALLALAAFTGAAEAGASHGLSVFGELKYPADFKHFEFANPGAPKGGKMSLIGQVANNTFDSFNGFILKGDPAQGLDLLFDSLMARATDEPDSVYGLVAKSAEVAADRMSVSFELRSEARFSDGTPVTAEDVCDSFRLLKANAIETLRITIRDVEACDVLGQTSLRYRFKGERTRDLPTTVAGLPIFSKAYYGSHDFAKSTLDEPLGSGPYVIKSYKPGEYVSYRRREDYWAKDLPVNVGRYNFDEVRYEYFRDRIAGFEALKSGVLDLREEYTSREWATAYNFPAIRDGRVIKLELPDETPSGAQGFYINMRREKFKDIRVRKALNLAFDFEWDNKNLFYGAYKRTESFFELSPLKAEGPPTPEELALLAPFKDKLRPEVFQTPELPPVSDGSGQDRKLLRKASQLLDEAGWKADGTFRKNDKGETLSVEFLNDTPAFERVLGPLVKNLQLLGIDASIRNVDESQYQARRENFDYDIVSSRFSSGLTPGDDLRVFFGSESAKLPGSFNVSGVASPEIDQLMNNVVAAKTREELNIAGRALDRVLRAEWFWIPNWHKGSFWVAVWDKFGRPPIKPKYDRGFVDTWWYDADKAAKLGQGN